MRVFTIRFAEKTDRRPQHVLGSVLFDSPVFRTSSGYVEGVQETRPQNLPQVNAFYIHMSII